MTHDGPSASRSAWWALPAFPAAMVAPVAVARRSSRVPMWAAWCVHLAAMGLWYVAMLGISVWEDGPAHLRPASWLRKLVYQLSYQLYGWDEPEEWAWGCLTLIAIEGGGILLAWCLMSWAARPERVTDSFIRSLQRVWLLTPFAAVVWLVLRAVPSLLDYYAGIHDTWPLLLVHLAILTLIIVGALWCLLRAISVGWQPGRAACRWPGGCEMCGYSLSGSIHQPACPECGTPVAQSLRDSPRLGTPWARRQSVGRLRAWWRTSVEAVLRPTRLGRSIQMLTPDSGRGSLLAVNLGLVFIVNVIGCTAIFQAQSAAPGSYIVMDWRDGVIIGSGIGMVAMPIALLLLLASASLVGTFVGSGVQRNILPAAMQASCCLGGWMVAWLTVVWGWSALCIICDHWIDDLAQRLAIDNELLIFVTYMALTVVGAAGHLWLHTRIVRAARFANR